MALRILHTADWHLGLRFRGFAREDGLKLGRARLDAVERILRAAEQQEVDAVLAAGDLFNEPVPERDWWHGLQRLLVECAWKDRPLVLCPGNHDPLVTGSPYQRESEFRRGLPDWVHVVDEDDFTLELGPDAVLHAAPCRSQAGSRDLALSLPAREPGDERTRIGMVHGTTFDLAGHETNFPIARDAAERRGFDYLAVGDTHAFRDVRPDSPAPIVYPSAPEATNFGERDTGACALVFFPKGRRRRPRIERLEVAHWIWREARCSDLDALRALREEDDLERTVLRLHLEMTVGLDEEREVRALVEELTGTDATHGLAGVALVHEDGLRIDPRDTEAVFGELPEVLERTVARLRTQVGGEYDEVASRALVHLRRVLSEVDTQSGAEA